MAAVAIVATKRHWHVLTQSENGASFRYHRRPKALVAIVLLFFFLIPGIVYMAARRQARIASLEYLL